MDNETFIHGEFLAQTLASEGRNQGQIDAAISKFGKIVKANNSPELAFTTIYNSFGATDNVESKLLTIKSLIQNELREASKTYKVRSNKEILKSTIERFNAAISNAQILVNGELMPPEIFESAKVKIPALLQTKTLEHVAFASSAPHKRLKELQVDIK